MVTSLGSSGLFFFNDHGDMISTFGTIEFETEDIGGQLMLFNPDGKRIASLVSTENGDGMLVIYDKYGQVAFVAP